MADQALFSKAIAHQKKGQIETAISIWEKFLEKYPNSYEARNNLGFLYYANDQIILAVIQFEQALSLRLGSVKITDNLLRALKVRVAILEENKRNDEAITDLKRIAQLSPIEKQEKLERQIESFEDKIFQQVKKSDLPEEYQYLMGKDVLGERNIFRTMGNNPPILKSYMLYGSTLWKECGLSAKDRELVIFAVARELNSEYEWQQHYDIGQKAGVSVEEMRIIGENRLELLDGKISVALEYAQAFVRGKVTNEIHQRLREKYNDKEIVGIAMLASHYLATAQMLFALEVPLEDEFVGWDPE